MYVPGDIVAGRFELVEQIGQGGAGTVFKAIQTSLEREVALKVLHSDAAFAPDARRRFAREARAIARLNHPNIASVFDFDTDHDGRTLWIAMELIDGFELRELKYEPFDLMRTITLGDQIASALASAHARQIIHRDLKLQNVLVTKDSDGNEIAKLVDFGLAFSAEEQIDLHDAPGIGDEKTIVPMMLGTPRYMAPEILLGESIDHRVDIYALGVILFELITGKAPFTGEIEDVVRGHVSLPVPGIVAKNDELVPDTLNALIRQLMVKDRAFRISTANEIREVFATIAGLALSSTADESGGIFDAYGNRTIPPVLFGSSSSLDVSTGTWRRPSVSGPVVGRESQRRELENRIVNCLKHRDGGVVVLRGEHGAGKTRLAEWCRVRVEEAGLMKTGRFSFAEDDDMTVLRNAILHITNSPRDAETLRTALGPTPLDEVDISTCAQFCFPDEESRPRESANLIPTSEFLVEDTVIESPALDKNTLVTIVETFVAISEEIPVLLVFEDIHMASGLAYEVMERLLERITIDSAPLLVLATTIPPNLLVHRESIERVSNHERTWVCDLEPLRTEDTIELLKQVAPISETVAQKISARAKGNPLHALETLDWYRESDGLEFGSEWTFREGFDERSEVPETVAEMLNERRRRVVATFEDPYLAETFLRQCAVLGYTFPTALLHAVSDIDPSNLIDHFIDFHVLSDVDDTTLTFRHPMLRDVVTAEIDANRSMRDLHRRIAEAKIEFYGPRKNDFALELADHFSLAKDPSNAFYYLVKAARRATVIGDLSGAMKLYERAESLGEHVASRLEGATTAMSTDGVKLEVAHLERRVGNLAIARRNYRELVTSSEAKISTWAHWGLGMLAIDDGELVDAEQWFETMVSFGAAEPGAVLFADAVLASYRGELVGAHQTFRKITSGSAALLHDAKVQICLTGISCNTTDLDVDLVALEESTRSAGNRAHLADFQLVNGVVSQKRGEWNACEQSLNLAERIYREIGDRRGQARTTYERGMLTFQRGGLREAARLMDRAITLNEPFDLHACGWCAIGVARAKRCYEEPNSIELDDAESVFKRIGDSRGNAHVGLWRGLENSAEAEWFINVADHLRTCADHTFEAIAIGYAAVVAGASGDFDTMNTAVGRMFSILDDNRVVERELLEIADALAVFSSELESENAFFVEALAIDLSTVLR